MHGGISTRIGSFDCLGDPHGALGVSRKLVVDPNEHSRVERRGLAFRFACNYR
jgi:hypothetical protein